MDYKNLYTTTGLDMARLETSDLSSLQKERKIIEILLMTSRIFQLG